MANIFVDVHVLGNKKTYEFKLDDAITVSAAKARMMEVILQIEERTMTFNNQIFLCDLDTENILPDNMPLSTANVKSGHRLLLI